MNKEQEKLLADFNSLVDMLVASTKEFNTLDQGDLKGSVLNHIFYHVEGLRDYVRELHEYVNDAK
jgi:hypothetical protein